MRLSDGVEWAIHCCTVLAFVPADGALPAAALAEFHGVPPAYLAKHLQSLSREGIVESVPGPRGGYRLARPAAEVSLLDIVLAIEGAEPAFRCSEIRQRGPAAMPERTYRLPCAIARAMWDAEQVWRDSLASISVAGIAASLSDTVSPKAAAKAAAWFSEVVR